MSLEEGKFLEHSVLCIQVTKTTRWYAKNYPLLFFIKVRIRQCTNILDIVWTEFEKFEWHGTIESTRNWITSIILRSCRFIHQRVASWVHLKNQVRREKDKDVSWHLYFSIHIRRTFLVRLYMIGHKVCRWHRGYEKNNGRFTYTAGQSVSGQLQMAYQH